MVGQDKSSSDRSPPYTEQYSYQDLSRFRMPIGFRGRPAWLVQLWWLVETILFRPSPQILYGWRRMLLRLFGARVGKGVIVRPTAHITYPWKVSIGNFSWIGDHVTLYSLGPIEIGEHSVLSQHSYICAGDHDYRAIDFPIRGHLTRIGNQVWLASGVFVAPGAQIGDGSVVGARSTVTGNLPKGMVCIGTPARAVRPRL
ncbi:colanic acid biosynthesis acetyltransferase WcaF [Burkholderia sp. Bp8963]|uniref:putative colanic acid biosynthesis acetyltransferase n=1 Tax=Burkholderia sp. Bp8963 TaxID=2184547 RepID=UPI000F5A517F|nr:putative colanic acid biosynthesis acetyltransferase [Burkholderia sp. Bp8963]RQS69237.1 colanic acid biosynthesis acetyltransferase WcaF [Burkholderia sp. Bp8963]